MNEIQTQDAQLLEDAIAYYHALLANSRRLSGESVQMLEEQMPLRKLTLDGKPLCNVLRPHFLTRSQFDYIRKACLALTNGIARLSDVILGKDQTESERLLQSLGLTHEERRLLSGDTQYRAGNIHFRLDTLLSAEETLQFVGYNTASSVEASEVNELTDLFSELPLMQEFSQRFNLSRFNKASEDGTNSFRGKLFHNKMVFGLLTDERNAHYFSPEEQNYIDRHILSPYVVQERVAVAKEPFPVMQNGMIVFAERSVDCYLSILGDKVNGVFTRLSRSLNVTAGIVPTYIIEGRGIGRIRPADSEGCV